MTKGQLIEQCILMQRACDEAKQEAHHERQRSEVLKARLIKLTGERDTLLLQISLLKRNSEQLTVSQLSCV